MEKQQKKTQVNSRKEVCGLSRYPGSPTTEGAEGIRGTDRKESAGGLGPQLLQESERESGSHGIEKARGFRIRGFLRRVQLKRPSSVWPGGSGLQSKLLGRPKQEVKSLRPA